MSPNSLNHVKKLNSDMFEKKGKCTIKKKEFMNVIKHEYVYISKLFDVLDLASLSHGRRTFNEDADDSEDLRSFNIPEKIALKKNSSKKGPPLKSKSFPHTVDGLEKELDELKGTPMTYQRTLRKKGLQSRLVKKKRKENIKQQKALMKLGKKGHVVNGAMKQIKTVVNSNGNVVSNKFDFADCELKKENKRKLGTFSEGNAEYVNSPSTKHMFTKNCSINQSNSEGFVVDNNSKDASMSVKSDQHKSNAKSIKIGSIKEEHDIGGIGEKLKPITFQKPIFNKENKMVFSKVYIPENKKLLKNKTDKNPKIILQKLQENSKKVLELVKENKEKATLLQEKQKWAAALKRATGEKVRDDPELLKKTIAREKNKKARSQKKWQARIDRVQSEKEDKQKKRTDNIQARKTEKKKRKLKKAIKRGSYVQL